MDKRHSIRPKKINMNIMRVCILLLCILQLPFLNIAIGQELIVRDLKQDPTDISASTHRRLDFNNEPCALLKIQVIDQVIAVEGVEIIGDFQRFGATTWIYVPHGTKQLTLLFEEHNPVNIQMQNYDIDQLNRLSTYVLTLFDKSGYSDPENPTDAIAQYELALDYRLGRRGRTVDNGKAFNWFLKSAEQEYDKAQSMMGTLYMETFEKFTRNPSDFDKSILWWEKAAGLGNVAAHFNLAIAYVNHATIDNCEEYNSKGFQWALKAAEQGHVEAMELVGDCLTALSLQNTDYKYRKNLGLEHCGIKRDIAQGIKWYERASNLGSASASYQMGVLYQIGIGVKKDKKLAQKWYEKSYDQGNEEARTRLIELGLKFDK